MHYYYIDAKTGDFYSPEEMKSNYAALVAEKNKAVLDGQGNVMSFEEYTKDMPRHDLWKKKPQFVTDGVVVLTEYDCIEFVEDIAVEKLLADSTLLAAERKNLRQFVHTVANSVVDHDITGEMAEELENRITRVLAEKGC